MSDSLKNILEISERSDDYLTEHDLGRLTGLLASQLQSAGPDELPDELLFDALI